MILILADPPDASALWLQQRLAGRSSKPVRVITPSQLIYSQSIAHQLSTNSQSAQFLLAGGEKVDLETASGIINRVQMLPTAHLRGRDGNERVYAESELHAFMLGLLSSLSCPVLNSPAPEALWGRNHGWIQALHLAALAGVKCPQLRCSPGGSCGPPVGHEPPIRIFVLDGQLLGPLLPPQLRDCLIQFAASWGARLVQVELDADQSFRSATSFVDFRIGGELLVRAIARVLGA